VIEGELVASPLTVVVIVVLIDPEGVIEPV
jgi:hypothetical protein